MVGIPTAWTALVLAAIAASYVLASCFLNYRKLPHVPGPLLAKIGPFWMLYHTLRGDMYLAVAAAIQKYGSPILVAPDYVVTDDVEVLRIIYAPRSTWLKGRWFDAMRLGADRDNVMTLVDEKAHAEQRSRLIPGYSGKETPGSEAAVDKSVAELISVIHRDYVSNNLPLDFARLAGFMTLDVLTKIAFDLEVGYLKDHKDHYDYQKSVAEFAPIMNLCCNHPTIFKILNSRLVMSLLRPKPEDKVGQGALIGRAHVAVADHFNDQEKENSGTMIASWKRHGVTQAQCQDETMLLIMAGSDSTSTALRSTFLHVTTSPRVYAALNKEIDDALARGAISFPVIKMSEAKELPYLCAIIKEGLRIFAPLHGLGSHYTKEPFEINGKRIPPNIEVGVDQYSMPRNKKYLGPDADEFRPERWVEADAETTKKYNRALDMTFGLGKSTCLGQNLALAELHKAIFEVSRYQRRSVFTCAD